MVRERPLSRSSIRFNGCAAVVAGIRFRLDRDGQSDAVWQIKSTFLDFNTSASRASGSGIRVSVSGLCPARFSFAVVSLDIRSSLTNSSKHARHRAFTASLLSRCPVSLSHCLSHSTSARLAQCPSGTIGPRSLTIGQPQITINVQGGTNTDDLVKQIRAELTSHFADIVRGAVRGIAH